MLAGVNWEAVAWIVFAAVSFGAALFVAAVCAAAGRYDRLTDESFEQELARMCERANDDEAA